MSVPTPQFQFNILEGSKFSWFWVDFFQRIYQAIGTVNQTYSLKIDNQFTLILLNETQFIDIPLKGAFIGDSVNITLQTIDIGLVYQASIVESNKVRIHCTNITSANIAITAGILRLIVWSF